ncbi:site-specific integrase [Humisphaera borealis]|uniref:Site-specific integrase n=1 Tax=Humisphaera borealis TaxID=2807512 RepID=A0A7M2X6T2_9BACT|nr:site-specific integrase [Humisphaera borealis]
MATIGTEPNGYRRVLFVAADGSRKTVRLGKCSERDAEQICRHIEALAATTIHGQPLPRPTAIWVGDVGDKLHDRLARASLVEPRVAVESTKLGAFTDSYLLQRAGDVKPGTMIVMRQARRWLVKFLGEGKAVASVTPSDADAYRAFLQSESRAKATVAKWCGYARHFFEVARRRRLISENPFSHIKGTVRGNPARRKFIPATDVQKVIDAAHDPQWKLLIALARWGGLRIPSEALALTWNDVDFHGKRFVVRSSKTEHHQDGGVRVVPMFPELEAHFHAVFAAAPEGSIYVISRYRDAAMNLRTQLVRYITAAGLTPWPKPWQNMRATRATELADLYPSHVCAGWLGHTEAVADEFYRQTTDEHFRRATEAARNPAQQSPAGDRRVPSVPSGVSTQTPHYQGNAVSCDVVQNGGLGALGFEPRTKGL